MPDVKLPKLADTLVEGTVARWLKRPGERVGRGEPLVEVETDKVNSELESPYEGVLTEIVAAEGSTVPVGEVIARIEEAQGAEEPPAEERAAQADGGAELASETSPGLSPMRRRIAERMQEARATIRQGSCSAEVELADKAPEDGWTAVFVRALAEAGGYSEIGVAVDVPGGLVVPVVREAGRRTIGQLSATVSDLVRRARENRLERGEASGGQATVTNVGSLGTLLAFPLVNPGQPVILAPGAVVDGRCWLTLCYDVAGMRTDQAESLLDRLAARLTGT